MGPFDRFNHNYIGVEHLLLATASSAGVAAATLEAAGATSQRIRETLERMDT
jgi:hypothetical protein